MFPAAIQCQTTLTQRFVAKWHKAELDKITTDTLTCHMSHVTLQSTFLDCLLVIIVELKYYYAREIVQIDTKTQYSVFRPPASGTLASGFRYS